MFSRCSPQPAMPPKQSVDVVARRLEREWLRSEVLARHHAKKGYGKIADELSVELKRKITKSTVQSIVRTFKGRGSVIAKRQEGRPTKMKPRYASV